MESLIGRRTASAATRKGYPRPVLSAVRRDESDTPLRLDLKRHDELVWARESLSWT
jgi:hypothetical protein